jgi:hypothetical protein
MEFASEHDIGLWAMRKSGVLRREGRPVVG